MKNLNSQLHLAKPLSLALLVSVLGGQIAKAKTTIFSEDFSSFTAGNDLAASGTTSSGIGTFLTANDPIVEDNAAASAPAFWPTANSSNTDGQYLALDLGNDLYVGAPSDQSTLLVDATLSFSLYVRSDHANASEPGGGNYSTNQDGFVINIESNDTGATNFISRLVFSVDGGVYAPGGTTDLDMADVFSLNEWVDVTLTFGESAFDVLLDDGSNSTTISSVAYERALVAETDTYHRVQLRETGSSSGSSKIIFVDDVEVTTVPEPSVIALCLGAVSGVIGLAKRRRV